MPSLRFAAIPTEQVNAYREGKPDANGQIAERHISDGSGVPCRHCLTEVGKGEPYLILSHRPFGKLQPYAEQGPIFLHAENCPRYADENRLPAMYQGRQDMLMRGYNAEDRIIYGTGRMVAIDELEAAAGALLDDTGVAYVHLRSATNNCFQFCIDRA